MRPLTVLLAALLAASLVACAVVPAQEMSDARQAIQAAEAAGAGERAPRPLGFARALLEQAEAELAVQDYAAARRSAQASKDAAIQAREAADEFAKSAPQRN